MSCSGFIFTTICLLADWSNSGHKISLCKHASTEVFASRVHCDAVSNWWWVLDLNVISAAAWNYPFFFFSFRFSGANRGSRGNHKERHGRQRSSEPSPTPARSPYWRSVSQTGPPALRAEQMSTVSFIFFKCVLKVPVVIKIVRILLPQANQTFYHWPPSSRNIKSCWIRILKRELYILVFLNGWDLSNLYKRINMMCCFITTNAGIIRHSHLYLLYSSTLPQVYVWKAQLYTVILNTKGFYDK